MGDGSKAYMIYYCIAGIIYLAVSIASFVNIGEYASDCQQQCPLLIRDSSTYEYSQCACYDVFLPNGSMQEFAAWGFPTQEAYNEFLDTETRPNAELTRYQQISAIWNTQQRSCYICNSLDPSSVTVFSPCPQYSPCQVAGVLGFSAQKSFASDDPCKILVSGNAVLPGTVVGVLYGFAVFYVLMAASCFLISLGFYMYVDKWGDDYGNLSRCERWMGFVCKNFPIVVRICNFFVLFFLVFSIVLVWGYRVCETAPSSTNGQYLFFAQVTGLTLAVVAVWILSCVGGSSFNHFVPQDTPFFTPKNPVDHRDSRAYRCCVRFCHLILRRGP